MAPVHWVPLESNPEVLTRFARALGLPRALAFSDVWSPELLDLVPAPRHAVLLLFPLTPRILAAAAAQPPPPAPPAHPPYFCKQTIGNACGTIALLHAALNAPAPFEEGSFLARFAESTRDLTPEQRAAALEESPGLDAVHGQFAQVRRAAPRVCRAVAASVAGSV